MPVAALICQSQNLMEQSRNMANGQGGLPPKKR